MDGGREGAREGARENGRGGNSRGDRTASGFILASPSSEEWIEMDNN